MQLRATFTTCATLSIIRKALELESHPATRCEFWEFNIYTTNTLVPCRVIPDGPVFYKSQAWEEGITATEKLNSETIREVLYAKVEASYSLIQNGHPQATVHGKIHATMRLVNVYKPKEWRGTPWKLHYLKFLKIHHPGSDGKLATLHLAAKFFDPNHGNDALGTSYIYNFANENTKASPFTNELVTYLAQVQNDPTPRL